MSIVSVFAQYKPVFMAFTSSRFKTHIVDGIGVMTSHDNKMGMVQELYQILLDGRMVISATCVTATRSDIDSRVQPVPIAETIDMLSEQLKRIRDHDDGTISGKTLSGDCDDLAMALMMNVYWSLAVRSYEGSGFL